MASRRTALLAMWGCALSRNELAHGKQAGFGPGPFVNCLIFHIYAATPAAALGPEHRLSTWQSTWHHIPARGSSA